MARLARPVNRRHFRGSPVLTNAWYMAEANSVTIPLGELLFPALTARSPAWARLGGLGALVGHELSHGFFGECRQKFASLDYRVRRIQNIF